jgi:cobalt/nickel transport protein
MNKKTGVIIFPIFVVLSASLFASKHPDALEVLAINYGFDKQAKETASIFAGYSFPFINNQFLSTLCAGVTGLILLYVLYKVINSAVELFIK